MLPAAVLWDMDGTLIDTEPFWIAAEHELVEEHGGVWSDDLAHTLVGNALEVSAQFILDHSPVDLGVVEVVETLLAKVIVSIRGQIPWRPGALDLLSALAAAGVPCALVTMSWRSLVDAVLDELPAGTFAVVVTGDEVAHGKPHPEPYLAAASLLGVDPARCVAIEDSPTGVRSAVAAGVPAIAVPHVVPVPHIDGAVQVGSLVGLGVDALAAHGARLTPAHHA
jgi:HAD superfamily hydrolase (TIGR01509 family)